MFEERRVALVLAGPGCYVLVLVVERTNSIALRDYLETRVSPALVVYGTSNLKSVLLAKVLVVLLDVRRRWVKLVSYVRY
jgi:hypothetical protein